MGSVTLQDLKDFAAEIVMLKAKAGQIGLWRTMHSLEEGVTEVGYEIADIIEGNHPTKIGE